MDIQPYVKGVEEARNIENAEINLAVQFRAKLTIDGDHYCWLYGDNMQDSIAKGRFKGQANSPARAALASQKGNANG